MKALLLESASNFVYTDVPDPVVADDEVVIRVAAVGICGSDVHGMDGSTGRRIPPLVMGHEAAGTIASVGKGVSSWSIGDRVTFDSTIYRQDDWYTEHGMYNLSEGRMVLGVSTPEFRRNGAFAEYVAVPQHILHKIPDEVSFTQAATVEPVAVAAHAVGLTPLKPDDTAVVVGCGMIGLFIIQVLRARGCSHIVAIDLEETKLKLARELGADAAIPPEKSRIDEVMAEFTEGRGADVVLEAVGIQPTVNTAIASVRRGGTVCLVGNLSPTVDIPLQTVVTGQIRLQGSCAICGEYPTVLAMMARKDINVEPILSAEAPLSEGAEWFQRLSSREPGLLKVILKP
jgi:L-iditol 2-dehydrogenase